MLHLIALTIGQETSTLGLHIQNKNVNIFYLMMVLTKKSLKTWMSLFNNYQVIGVEESNIAGSSSSAHVQTEKKILKSEKQTPSRKF